MSHSPTFKEYKKTVFYRCKYMNHVNYDNIQLCHHIALKLGLAVGMRYSSSVMLARVMFARSF